MPGLAGAVTGGGLTIVANAPDPAGIAILRQQFDEGIVQPPGFAAGRLATHGGGGCGFLDFPLALRFGWWRNCHKPNRPIALVK